jgi:hypothetical protein
MGYTVLGIVCIIALYVIWATIKEKKAIKEEEYRQNRFAIEQYNRNRSFKTQIKTIEELRKKLEKNE